MMGPALVQNSKRYCLREAGDLYCSGLIAREHSARHRRDTGYQRRMDQAILRSPARPRSQGSGRATARTRRTIPFSSVSFDVRSVSNHTQSRPQLL